MDVVELTREMCAIPSITNDEKAIVDFVHQLLTQKGYEVSLQTVGGDDSRQNLLAIEPGVKPEIMLTTHLDTVPPFIPPTDSEDGEWLWGRGVCDAKGIAASMIVAGDRLREAGENRFALLFVVGEETCSDGAKKAADNFAPSVRYFIDGEPTDMKLVSAMKGAMLSVSNALKITDITHEIPAQNINIAAQILADILTSSVSLMISIIGMLTIISFPEETSMVCPDTSKVENLAII